MVWLPSVGRPAIPDYPLVSRTSAGEAFYSLEGFAKSYSTVKVNGIEGSDPEMKVNVAVNQSGNNCPAIKINRAMRTVLRSKI
jgi:hypothetical protein